MSKNVRIFGPSGFLRDSVVNEDADFFYTSFGTFRKSDGRWVVDDRWSLLLDDTSTESGSAARALTFAKLNEAAALIKALAPQEAPANALFLRGASGLRIMKADMLPEDTIMVSKRLFDILYASSEKMDCRAAHPEGHKLAMTDTKDPVGADPCACPSSEERG